MRKILGWLLLTLTLLTAPGCSSVRSRQSAVDAANRAGLERPDFRSAMLMHWDNAPKEWLLLSDAQRGPWSSAVHSILTFYDGRLALSTRSGILNGTEMSSAPPDPNSETEADRLKRYSQAGREVRQGKAWSGAPPVTMIHPKAVPYREAGTLEFQGRAVRLLAGDVTSDHHIDPFAVYDQAWVLVGLDQDTGDLVFEYIVNRLPRKEAANRILTVFARPGDGMDLTASEPTSDRVEAYMATYTTLHSLEAQLYPLMPPAPTTP